MYTYKDNKYCFKSCFVFIILIQITFQFHTGIKCTCSFPPKLIEAFLLICTDMSSSFNKRYG